MSTEALDKLLKDNPALYRALMEQVTCEKSLYKFTETMWEFVEPANPFIGNWHLEAIAEHLEAVTDGYITRLLINIPPGPGWVENIVTTSHGRVRLGDITTDHCVLTHTGKYKKVEAVHSQGVLPLLKITTWNGRITWAAPSHPYLTPSGWVDAKDLAVGDVLAAIVPQEDLLCGIPIPDYEARLLGYLVGDGSLTQATVQFTNADMDTIEDFAQCVRALGFDVSIRKRGNVSLCNILGGAAVHLWLKKWGLFGKNSYEKFIPSALLASSKETLRQFMGAYWSCDGMIEVRDTKKRGSIYRSSCCTVSEKLAKDIQHALTRLGMNARIRRKSRPLETKAQPGGVYRYIDVEVQNEGDVALFSQMPITKRKLDLAKKCRRTFPRHIIEDRIVSIEDAGVGECKCLTVEDDHSMTWDDIAVHNTMKSLMTDVFWPAWEWINKPHTRYICTSYSAGLTERDNIRFRQVIMSDLYRAMWGDKFGFSRDSFNVTKVGNDKTGWKIATSTDGMGTGERGNRVIVDDPHNVKDGESEAKRKTTLHYFTEVLPTRVTDPISSAICVIMQRVHEEDVSGYILSKELGYTHLMLPMEFEPDRKCYTFLPGGEEPFFEDPRTEPGELLFPARMPDFVVERDKKILGPYASAGQFQQSPVPRGGGIIKREYWKLWPEDGETFDDGGAPTKPLEYPADMDFVIASTDTAYTKEKESDFNAIAILGVWRKLGVPKIMLMHCWKKRLDFRGVAVPKLPDETDKEYRIRRKMGWGMLEWTAYECARFKVDKLLIEGKATGITLAQEIRKVYQNEKWSTQLINPKGDKVARVYSVQHLWAEGMIYAPERAWADEAITEMQYFPKGAHDDLTDAITQGVKWLRDSGWALRREEVKAEDKSRNAHRGKLAPLYDV